MSMMITDLNSQINKKYSVNGINKTAPSQISFAAKKTADKDTITNSLNEASDFILTATKTGHYDTAIKSLKKDFNPNRALKSNSEHWTLSMLDNISFSKEKKEKIQSIILNIITNPNFNPNFENSQKEPLFLTILNKKPNYYTCFDKDFKHTLLLTFISNHSFKINKQLELNTQKHIFSHKEQPSSFIEAALENKDEQAVRELICSPSFKDPYKDHMQTLSKKYPKFTDILLPQEINELVTQGVLSSILEQTHDEQKTAATKKKAKAEADKAKKNQAKTEKSENILQLSSYMERYRISPSQSIPNNLNEVGGLTKAKKDIENYIIKPWQTDIRKKFQENNIEMPNGFLMYGPPGCGKTFIASVISKQTEYPLYAVNLANCGSSMAHETENEFEEIFFHLEDQYKRNGKPNILFLDEIDSICANREDMKTDWRKDEINAIIRLLNNASDKGIIVIGATNMISNLDPAVLRTGRFDKKIEIPLPTKDERKDILDKLINNKKITSSLLKHTELLAEKTEGKTCSDLAAIINTCGRNAIYNTSNNVTTDDFLNALKELEVPKKSKPTIGFNNDIK